MPCFSWGADLLVPFTCQYHQVIYDEQHQIVSENEGVMMVDKQHNVLWKPNDIDRPVIKIVGQSFWVIDRSLEQAVVSPLSSIQGMQGPLALLSGDEHKMQPKLIWHKKILNDQIIIDAKPKEDAAYQSIHLVLVNHHPMKMIIKAVSGHTHHLRFSLIPSLKKTEWMAHLSKNYDIVYEGEDA
jgi:outer membrane lipoprotein-sorting protein